MRIIRRRVEADVSIVLPVLEPAGLRIRPVINHPSDAERIDVAERADVVAGGLALVFVILPSQVVLETVRRRVSAVVRREIGRIASRNGRSVARPDGGAFDGGIVGSLEDRGRSSTSRSAIVGLRSRIRVQTLQPGRRVARSARVIIVARNRRENRSGSDCRRRVVAGSEVVSG